MLGIKSKGLDILGKCSNTKLCPQARSTPFLWASYLQHQSTTDRKYSQNIASSLAWWCTDMAFQHWAPKVKRITTLQAILNYIETLSRKQNNMKWKTRNDGGNVALLPKKSSSFLLFSKQYRITTLQLAVILHWELLVIERLWHTRRCLYLYEDTVVCYGGLSHDGFWCSWGVVQSVHCILRDGSMRKDSLTKGHLDTALDKQTKKGAGHADIINKNHFKQRKKVMMGLNGSLWLLCWD